MLLVEDRLAAAREHIAAGRRDSAGLILEGIIDINPSHAEALRCLAQTRLAQGKADEAMTLAGNAVRRQPGNVEGLALLARIALTAGQPEVAAAAADQGLAIDPTNAEIAPVKAGQLAASGDYPAAERLLGAALARHPDDAGLLAALARLYVASGADAPALDYAQRALATDPGMQLADLGDHQRAIACLERAYLLDPADPLVSVQWCNSLLATGALSEAHRIAQRMIGLYPTFLPGWQSWVQTMISGGEADAALARFAKVAQAHSERVPALLALAGCYRLAGRSQQALALLKPVLGRADQLPAEYRTKAATLIRDCCLSLGRIDEMRAVLPLFDIDKALGLMPGDDSGAAIDSATVVIDSGLSALEVLVLLRFAGRFDGKEPRDIRGASRFGEIASLVTGCRFAADDQPIKNIHGASIPAFPLSAILSLPEPAGTPDAAIPYVEAPEARRAIWRRSLQDLPRPLIGIAWDETRPGLLLDDLREAIGPFQGTLVSLVWDEGRPQLGAWPEIIDAGVHFSSLADLAALITEIDAIVGPDGLPLHIAGAMGRPALLLSQPNAAWYWHAEADRASWYPSVGVLKTNHIGNWAERVGDVAAGLEKFLSAMTEPAGDEGERA